MMKIIASLLYGRMMPTLAGVLALFSFALPGFQGFTRIGIERLTGARNLALKWSDSPAALMNRSIEPESGFELLGALFMLTLPGTPEWNLVISALLASTLATVLIVIAARRLGGPLAGWCSAFLLLTSAPWMGHFTTGDPATWLIPLIIGFILIWHAQLRWWLRSLLGAPILGISILLWPGAILIPAALLTIDLLAPLSREQTPHRGLVAGPTISLDRIITPIAALLLLTICPLFQPDPLDALGAYFLAALEMPAIELVFRGNVYPPHRPPLYFGAVWLAEQLTLATVLALFAGIMYGLFFVKGKNRRFALSLGLISLITLMLPVFFRSPRPLGAHFEPLVFITAIPLAGLAISRFFSHFLGPLTISSRLRRVAIATIFIAGSSILLEAPRALSSPRSYRSPLMAQFTGWSAATDMALREPILPPRVIEASGVADGGVLLSSGWQRHIDAYRSMNLIENFEITADISAATHAIRMVPPVAANRFARHAAPFTSALPDSRVHLYPALHRPAFFIDIVDDD